ncbi:hypothetical protein AAHB41_01850 [Pediococcus pentosaceus]|jgi:hypothetical protein|uniref:Uncharacterized protein n=4 Tax=Pediococcus pentosaceus TaxID=1255 RepID=A0A0R2H9G8_PEDPE|nr:hypothetical protein [Pediococcus pentosaceus]AXR44016.1 hypothetical protein CKK51_07870 [Pediococcus pentosaceus]KAF0351876.1 hypothetical protein GBO26_02325 [Pediococcus pentosaceus]KAF0414219.1 hypothetical protein GBO79_04950 [Pediococcus pentosaceus]KAF0503964.1 hypothetical protein GBP22_01855 [Pediococcus pentosaceus]KAF0519548.1 hypothetical protein GBP31_04640 [Pediococcus pentosaceus]
MRDDYIFVHLESIVNLIYSRGITANDFLKGVLQIPTNILLLNREVSDDLTIDNHTFLNEINGAKKVSEYLMGNHGPRNWIDFSQRDALSELTPADIANLLYMGHMKTHNDTPFSYKLQNDYVYLDIGENQVKTYYRRLKNFYLVLNQSIIRHAEQAYNEHRIVFRRGNKFAELPAGMVRQLIPVLGEGLIFAFDQAFEQDREYRIPILIASDSNLAPTLRSKDSLYNNAQQIAILKYNLRSKHWHFIITNPQAFDADALY